MNRKGHPIGFESGFAFDQYYFEGWKTTTLLVKPFTKPLSWRIPRKECVPKWGSPNLDLTGWFSVQSLPLLQDTGHLSQIPTKLRDQQLTWDERGKRRGNRWFGGFGVLGMAKMCGEKKKDPIWKTFRVMKIQGKRAKQSQAGMVLELLERVSV